MPLSLPQILHVLQGHRLVLVAVGTFLFALTVTFGITGHFYAHPDTDALALGEPVVRRPMDALPIVPPVAAARGFATVDPSFVASAPEVATAAPKAAAPKTPKPKAAKRRPRP